MTDSILNSTKKLLGVPEDYDVFDLDIQLHINSVFSTLNQLGAGPENGFMITGTEETWDEFLEEDQTLNMVKSYLFTRVKLLFDPPPHAFMTSALKDQIAEYEWRIKEQAEYRKVNQNGSNSNF